MGRVKVEEHRGNLRLRWSHRGKRQSFSLGFPDSTPARKVAESIARTMEADLVTDNFDASLKKYRPNSPTVSQGKDSAIALFDAFTAQRAKAFTGSTEVKYKALRGRLLKFLGEDTAIADLDGGRAEEFCATMADLRGSTEIGYRTLLKAFGAWLVEQGQLEVNPWEQSVKQLKVPPRQKPKPFTKTEVTAILNGFKAHPDYRHYLDYVRFLLGTGTRLGEAIALQWKHLSDDCTKAWIGESVSRGRRKSTKTNRDREFRLSPELTAMLLLRKGASTPEDLVFPAPEGGAIDDHNFRNRAWVKVLSAAGVAYRKPYNTRHTFICHALEKGVSPMLVAELTGHDPQTLFKHYAAYAQTSSVLPSVFDDL